MLNIFKGEKEIKSVSYLILTMILLLLVFFSFRKKLILEDYFIGKGEYEEDALVTIINSEELDKVIDKKKLIYKGKTYDYKLKIDKESIPLGKELYKKVKIFLPIKLKENSVINFKILISKRSIMKCFKDLIMN